MAAGVIDRISQPMDEVGIALADAQILRLPVSADAAKVRAYARQMLPRGTRFDEDTLPEPDSVALFLIQGKTDSRLHGGVRPCHLLFVALEHGADAEAFLCPTVFVDDLEVMAILSEQLGYQAWRSTFTREAENLHVSTEVYALGEHAAIERDVLTIRLQGEAGPLPSLQQRPKGIVHLLQVREGGRPAAAAVQVLMHTQIGAEGLNTSGEPLRKPVSAQLCDVGAFRNLDLGADLGLRPGPIDAERIEGLRAQRISLAPLSPESLPVRSHAHRAGSDAFIEPRVDPRAPPPYRFEDVNVSGFKFPADRERLQALVDALLNSDEQNFRYEVATPEVVVEYLEYPRMFSTLETRWRKRDDYTHQQELAVRLLVGKIEEDSGVATEPRVFCPFLFVSNWASMVSGREVMGLWKRMARFCPQRKFAAGTADDDMTPRLGDPVERRVLPLSGSDVGSNGCEAALAAQWQPDACVVRIQHARQRRWEDDALALTEVSASRAQGVLPWRQQDFRGSTQFRRAFARDWLRLSGAQYRTVQRLRFRHPGMPEYDQWIEAHYRVTEFRVYQPVGAATVSFGRFRDPQLAALLAGQTRLGDCVDASKQYIDVAKLLGLQRAHLSVPAAAWYLGRGNFEVDTVDRYA